MSKNKPNDLYVDLVWQPKSEGMIALLDHTKYKVAQVEIVPIDDNELTYIRRYDAHRYMEADDKFVLYIWHNNGEEEPIDTAPDIASAQKKADAWLYRWTENLLGNDR